MHPLFDQRLTDPAASVVRAALRRACSAANGRRKTGTVGLNDQNTASLAKRVAGEPEGAYVQSGTRSGGDTARLVLAWWTAPGGRKLVRVRAWRELWRERAVAPESPRLAEEKVLDARPAVWHLDPERITLVELDGVTECVAACGCGAIGTPASLAWAGGMCGPCRDRVEELGPESVAHEPGLLTAADFAPRDVMFTPDGTRVVAAGDNRYRAWDAATGQLLVSGKYRSPYLRPLRAAVSPDGRFLFLGDHDRQVVVAPLEAGAEPLALACGAFTNSAFWTGRPGELLVQGYQQPPVLVTVGEAGGIPCGSRRIAAALHAVHPVGSRAVFTDYGTAVVARVGRRGELREEYTFRLGVGDHDRTGNWSLGPGLVRFTADGERLLFVSAGLPDQHLELWNPSRPKALRQTVFPAHITDAHFSPDGEHLFVLARDGTVFVCHPGLLTHVRVRLRWHVGPATSLAVSPDGRTLATAGPEGVKLWPVGRLLEVL